METGAAPSRTSAVVFGIVFLGLAVRLVHNSAMMASPLYFFPVGGHTAFIDTAREILQGRWLASRVFTDNSPLYPYLLAPQLALFGSENYLMPRLVGIAVDCTTIYLVMRIAQHAFPSPAWIVSGLLYALYGPAVYFADEIIFIPYTLCFLASAVLAFLNKRELLGGFFCGLAVLSMPSLIVCVPLFFCALLMQTNGARRGAYFAIASAATLLPCPLLNYFGAGEFVLLTASGGHNFYIGHNPQAQAGYYLPNQLAELQQANRGSIFDTMKALAESLEHRSLKDSEVSSYYARKAMASIVNDPLREIRLLLERAAATVNGHEALTYGNYRFAESISPLLQTLPTFEWISGLAILGIFFARRRELLVLLVPLVGSVLTIFLFFFISRFRIPMIPFVCVFSGHGLYHIVSLLGRRRYLEGGAAVALILCMYTVGRMSLINSNAANEWNKVGSVYKVQKQFQLAEDAFLRAQREDPQGENSYRNLSSLYHLVGRDEDAERMKEEANRLNSRNAGATFERSLQGE